MDNNESSNILHWKIEESHPHLVEPLKNALSNVKDPEIGFSVVQLGLIREVEIEEGKAKITMVLTTPFCPYGPSLIESAKQMAEKGLGMPVEMMLSPEMWESEMMDEEIRNDWGLF